MAVFVSATHKIRIAFLIVVIILTFMLLSHNYNGLDIPRLWRKDVLNDQLSKAKVETSDYKKVPKEKLQQSTGPIATLLEIAAAINYGNHYYYHESSKPYSKFLTCEDTGRERRTFFGQRGTYWILYNFIIGRRIVHCDETVTYTTHADFTYLTKNLIPLMTRWGDAPVSLSLYVPRSDFSQTLRRLIYLRECSSAGDRIKDYLTVHFYFDQSNCPDPLTKEMEQVLFSNAPIDCQNQSHLEVLGDFNQDATTAVSYRKEKKLIYPVNVGRNVAKEMSMTYFVLPSDIELYPSLNLPMAFVNMIQLENALMDRVVYVLPIFELDGTITVNQLPQNKQELVSMVKTKKAIPFHAKVCSHCHKIPKQTEWFDVLVPDDSLTVFHVANRTGDHEHWEPIFIGTKDDPGYDERLSWDGLKDKMTQGYILCVLGYEMRILDNAFLVHTPGIKKNSPVSDKGRKKIYEQQFALITNEIIAELKLLYGQKSDCVL